MNGELYRKLIRFVKNGGQLLMTAAHLNTSLLPQGEYEPYLNGDWSELFGVRIRSREDTRLPYGIKFKAEPPCGWRFPLWSPNCDPKYSADLECDGAETLAVASERFADSAWNDAMHGVIYSRKLGLGYAILVNSLEYPGADGLKELYGFLMDSCCESNQQYPKVECSDRVRFAVYESAPGSMLYLLNTEENLVQEVVVHYSATCRNSLRLLPGEIREITV